ncbi:hypothetical protein EG68_00225 [Paragonimus skrjabini miyazakii]|uniref:Uncharacterized protein n=1 Tax=Paragonimus skrjabini miyazakii TaxID=59628 RepID=A0A8S9Z9D1_9TREM|nr:hypothetical protein EG68_00225 [Paragonimus skrjabini miyazakii]
MYLTQRLCGSTEANTNLICKLTHMNSHQPWVPLVLGLILLYLNRSIATSEDYLDEDDNDLEVSKRFLLALPVTRHRMSTFSRPRRFMLGLPVAGLKHHKQSLMAKRLENDDDEEEDEYAVNKRFLLGLPYQKIRKQNYKRFLLGLPMRRPQ